MAKTSHEIKTISPKLNYNPRFGLSLPLICSNYLVSETVTYKISQQCKMCFDRTLANNSNLRYIWYSKEGISRMLSLPFLSQLLFLWPIDLSASAVKLGLL